MRATDARAATGQFAHAKEEERPSERHPADQCRLLRPEAGEVDAELGSRDDEQRGESGKDQGRHAVASGSAGPKKQGRERRQPDDEQQQTCDPPEVGADEIRRRTERVPLGVVPDLERGPEAACLVVREPQDAMHLCRRPDDRRPVVDK